VIDIERLRQSRAAAVIASGAQAEVVAHGNLEANLYPAGSVNPYQAGAYIPPIPPPVYVHPPAVYARPPAIARMRIFFGQKKSWFRLLSQPARLLLVSTIVLLLLGGTLMVLATRSSGKLAAASDVGDTLGGLAVREDGDETPVEEIRTTGKGTRSADDTRRTAPRKAPVKKPSIIKRGFNKLKKKIGDIF
jgi:hypothetical protein